MTLLDPDIDVLHIPAIQIQVGDVIARRYRWTVSARSYSRRRDDLTPVKLRMWRDGHDGAVSLALARDTIVKVERASA